MGATHSSRDEQFAGSKEMQGDAESLAGYRSSARGGVTVVRGTHAGNARRNNHAPAHAPAVYTIRVLLHRPARRQRTWPHHERSGSQNVLGIIARNGSKEGCS